jgi:hypothetical protein
MLALLMASCGDGEGESSATTTTQTTNTITGSFTLLGQEDDPFSDIDGVYLADGSGGCSGSGGYEYIGPGLQAKVSNESGTVIGTGNLGPGDVIEEAAGSISAFQTYQSPSSTASRLAAEAKLATAMRK